MYVPGVLALRPDGVSDCLTTGRPISHRLGWSTLNSLNPPARKNNTNSNSNRSNNNSSPSLERDHPLVPGNEIIFHLGDHIMQSFKLFVYLDVVLKMRWSLNRVVPQEGNECSTVVEPQELQKSSALPTLGKVSLASINVKR